jgi:hypothetical protein
MQGGEELDRLVGAEEALVAVVPDQELRGHVAEEAEDARPVDQAAAVMGVVGREPQPQGHLHSVSPSFSPVAGTVASGVPWAVFCGGGVLPIRSSRR